MKELQDARARIQRVINEAESNESGFVAVRETLRIVLELDEDDTRDRPPTNVIIAELLEVLSKRV